MKLAWRLAALFFGIALITWAAKDNLSSRSDNEPSGQRRFIEPRLADAHPYAPCEQLPSPRAGRCSRFLNSAERELMSVHALQRFTKNGRSSPEDFHDNGVFKLLASEDASSLDRAISQLEEAAARSPQNARFLSDLAAAYFVRARQNDQPKDLIVALATIDRAVRADARLHEALFNRALFLQEMSLRTEAWFAWQDYLGLEGEVGWSEEAEARLARLRSPPPQETWSQQRLLLGEAVLRGDRELAKSIIVRFRQPARKYIEEDILGQWGEAMAAGQIPQATHLLSIARVTGEVLAEGGGDKMLQDAVALIDEVLSGSSEPVKLRNLIEGHRAYSRGFKILESRDIDKAKVVLEKADRAFRAAGSPLMHWSRLQIASCDYFHESFDEARRLLEEVARSTDRYLSVRGRTLFILGSMDLLQGKPGDSLKRVEQARELFVQIGEVENIATMDEHLGINLGSLGSDDSWRYLFRAIERLNEIQTYRRAFSILDEAGSLSLREGKPSVALSFQGELLEHARRWRDPEEIAAALQKRAETFVMSSRQKDALRDLSLASRQAERISDSNIRARMKAHIAVTTGQAHLLAQPRIAVHELTNAISYFSESPYRFYLSVALLLRARSFLALGENGPASQDFGAGLKEVESTRENLSDERLRVLFMDQATQLFDEMLAFKAGEKGGAEASFDLGERARARELLEDLAVSSLSGRFSASVKAGSPALLTVRELQRALPERTLVLKYAVLQNHTLLWALTKKGLRLWTLPIGSDGMERQVQLARLAIQAEKVAEERQALRSLYALLLAPVKTELRQVGDLVIVPDKSLNALPFSALVEPETSHYLLQDHAVIVAPSVNVYMRCLLRSRFESPASILALGDPEFDRQEFKELSRLPDAAEEAAAIASMYPRATLLTGGNATRRNFMQQLLRKPDVIQISAHSVVNASHPEYSRLLLASDPRDGDSGAFYSHDVRNLDLRTVQLVILAGCGTGAGRISASEGAMSLGRSFLAAGTPTVIASLWDVSDASSLRLLTELHRRLRSGEDPVTALRLSQLDQLASQPFEGKQPRNWASFQLVGAGYSRKEFVDGR